MTTLLAKATLEEYFDRDSRADLRHAYCNGEIVTMTGGTPTHNRILGNLFALLHFALRDRPYATFVTDQRLWIPDRAIATYPDIMVISEPIALMSGRNDTVIHPLFVAEVLSESTASYDRGEKFTAYRTIPTFC